MEMAEELSKRAAVPWLFQTTPPLELLWGLGSTRNPETRLEAVEPRNEKVGEEKGQCERPSKNGEKGRKVTIFLKKMDSDPLGLGSKKNSKGTKSIQGPFPYEKYNGGGSKICWIANNHFLKVPPAVFGGMRRESQ
jgi:hypothetical protein